jgi:hypothetical protein
MLIEILRGADTTNDTKQVKNSKPKEKKNIIKA